MDESIKQRLIESAEKLSRAARDVEAFVRQGHYGEAEDRAEDVSEAAAVFSVALSLAHVRNPPD